MNLVLSIILTYINNISDSDMKKTIVMIVSFFYVVVTFAGEGYLSEAELPNSFLTLAPFPNMNSESKGKGVFYPRFAEDKVVTDSLFMNAKFLNGR